jgi:hypothetical protein
LAKIKCKKCGEEFDPRYLSQVVKHLHNGMKLDKEYYGRKVSDGTESSRPTSGL